MSFNKVQTLSNRQRDEIARVGRVPRQYDLGALIFQYDSSTGHWRQWLDVVEFLAAGIGENFGANCGIITTATILGGQNSLDDGGFPSKEFSFLVRGVTLQFGLPYVPASNTGTNKTNTLRVAPFGALSTNTQDIAEYMIRAALQGAYMQYVTRNCMYELGPVEEMPAGVGVNDPKGGPMAFGVQMQGTAPLLRRDPIILPPSDPKYSNDYLFRLNLQDGAAAASFPVPAALSTGAAPADNDLVAIPIRLYMDGVYGVVDERTGEFLVADAVEGQILEAQAA